MNYPISGSCQCGQVTYQLFAAPLQVVACHCKECQKLSTSAFSITAVVKAADIVFRGALEQWQRTADSGHINGAKFCPVCGNRIYHFDPDQPDIIKLKPCNLEQTDFIVPTMHVWVSQKQPWFNLPDNVTVYERQP